MANYNNGLYLKEAIESVCAQSFSDWELIVGDDCSTDDSMEIIKPFLSDNRIRCFHNEKNLGYIQNLCLMITQVKGGVIGILDSDDTLQPETIKKIIEVYDNNSDVGFVYSQCNYCDESMKLKHLGYSAKIPIGKTNLEYNCVVAMRTFTKEAYLNTSGFDEEMLYAEDLDLTLKLEEVTKIYYLDLPLYNYRILPKSQTHGFMNECINRSSVALAKFKAYQRRLNTEILIMQKEEIAGVLFFGIFFSLIAWRLKLVKYFTTNFFQQNIFRLFLNFKFYYYLGSKIKKNLLLKYKN